MFKINKNLHFIKNLASDFERALAPSEDLLVASLNSPLIGECLQQGSTRLGLVLALEAVRDDHCWQLSGR
jgi:hypothetical protein